MAEEGNLANARASFISERKNNLDALLRQRFFWMNRFIEPNQFVVEVGAGAGFSQFYIQQKLHLTDAIKSDWIDTVADQVCRFPTLAWTSSLHLTQYIISLALWPF